MELALWALIMTIGGLFVAFLCEDLTGSPDKETTDSLSAGWTEIT